LITENGEFTMIIVCPYLKRIEFKIDHYPSWLEFVGYYGNSYNKVVMMENYYAN